MIRNEDSRSCLEDKERQMKFVERSSEISYQEQLFCDKLGFNFNFQYRHETLTNITYSDKT